MDLLVEGIVALFEFRRGEGALYAHLQQAVLFGIDGGQFRLDPSGILAVVVLIRNGLNDLHHSVHDRRLILRQLVEDLRHDLVQFRRPHLRCGAGCPPPIPIYPALPDLFLSFGAFQHLSVKAGPMLFTDDLAAVWIAVMELGGTLVGHHLGAAPLVEGIGPVP